MAHQCQPLRRDYSFRRKYSTTKREEVVLITAIRIASDSMRDASGVWNTRWSQSRRNTSTKVPVIDPSSGSASKLLSGSRYGWPTSTHCSGFASQYCCWRWNSCVSWCCSSQRVGFARCREHGIIPHNRAGAAAHARRSRPWRRNSKPLLTHAESVVSTLRACCEWVGGAVEHALGYMGRTPLHADEAAVEEHSADVGPAPWSCTLVAGEAAGEAEGGAVREVAGEGDAATMMLASRRCDMSRTVRDGRSTPCETCKYS